MKLAQDDIQTAHLEDPLALFYNNHDREEDIAATIANQQNGQARRYKAPYKY